MWRDGFEPIAAAKLVRAEESSQSLKFSLASFSVRFDIQSCPSRNYERLARFLAFGAHAFSNTEAKIDFYFLLDRISNVSHHESTCCYKFNQHEQKHGQEENENEVAKYEVQGGANN